ncbi:MAG: carbon monoxide dehydrogenase, partial [Planctomycetota bacterium]
MSIGRAIARTDGPAKLLGRAKFVDDLSWPDMLHAGVVRSPAPRGRIRRVRFDPAIDWSEFVIVDHRDIPGRNEIKLIENDQPALAADQVRHKYEPVVLLAHASARRLREALRAVTVEIDPLPAVLDPTASLTPELIQYGDDNVFKRIDIRKGDPDPVFAQAPHVLEREYRTGAQEHVYLEPNGMTARIEGDRLVIQGSMQCPYYVLDALTHAFGRGPDAFRVIQTPTGGGFGGKEEFPSLLAVHAALLCEKSGRPVKLIYDRHEDMRASTKRHPSIVRHKTAFDDEGRLLAMHIEVILDGGAYMTLSPVVLSRGTIHAGGPYRCEHIRVHGEARLTNSVPYGAFRGFGAPQTAFAMERQMNEIARVLRLDPAELRRRNLLRPGDTFATGQVFRDTTDLPAMLDRALAAAVYERRKEEFARFNAQHPYLRRGLGIATFHHGAGFTGAGEVYLASEATVAARPDGGVEVRTAQTDMGQGTTTILAQIAGEALGVPAESVSVATPDTARVPNSGPTVASRTAMVVGKLVERAAIDLARSADPAQAEPPSGDALRRAIQTWYEKHPGQELVGRAKYEKPPEVQWDEEHYRGDAYATYSYGAYVAAVEVDLRTFATRVTDFVAAQEVGRVLNPTLATGQIQGGSVVRSAKGSEEAPAIPGVFSSCNCGITLSKSHSSEKKGNIFSPAAKANISELLRRSMCG